MALLRSGAALAPSELARRVWARIEADAMLTHAAAMSFYLILALFPALLFVVTLVGLLPLHDVMDRLLAEVRRVLPDDAASLVERTLVLTRRGAHPSLLSLGAITALWAASAGMVAVINALNVVYRVTEPRPWWKRRVVALVLTVGLTAFMLAALALLGFGGFIGEALAAALGLGPIFALVWPALDVLGVASCLTVGVLLVYRWAPAQSLGWRWLGPGALFAVLAWLLVSLGLRVYVANFGNYNATYGSIGGAIVLLLWLFLSSAALLTGAEINSVLEAAARERRRR